VVIPLRSSEALDKPARGLNPLLEVDGRPVVLDTASLAPVPGSLLKEGRPLDARFRDDVHDALDALFGAC
jgi:hypothetical protein